MSTLVEHDWFGITKPGGQGLHRITHDEATRDMFSGVRDQVPAQREPCGS
jgi:hypothetical protein